MKKDLHNIKTQKVTNPQKRDIPTTGGDIFAGKRGGAGQAERPPKKEERFPAKAPTEAVEEELPGTIKTPPWRPEPNVA